MSYGRVAEIIFCGAGLVMYTENRGVGAFDRVGFDHTSGLWRRGEIQFDLRHCSREILVGVVGRWCHGVFYSSVQTARS